MKRCVRSRQLTILHQTPLWRIMDWSPIVSPFFFVCLSVCYVQSLRQTDQILMKLDEVTHLTAARHQFHNHTDCSKDGTAITGQSKVTYCIFCWLTWKRTYPWVDVVAAVNLFNLHVKVRWLLTVCLSFVLKLMGQGADQTLSAITPYCHLTCIRQITCSRCIVNVRAETMSGLIDLVDWQKIIQL